MKRINWIIGILIAVAIAVSVFIFFGRGIQKADVKLYFLNSAETSLVVENRTVAYRDKFDLPVSVVEALIKGPENSQNVRVINKNAGLKSIQNDGEGNLVADFDENIVSDDASKAVFPVYAVVKTLCAIDGVNSVLVTVNGKDFKAADGNVIGRLTSDDINLAIDTDTSEARNVILYFTDIATKKLVKEERTVLITDQQPIEQYIIAELIRGPENSDLSAVISDEVNLISVNISNNIGFVNFSQNFIDKCPSSAEEQEQAIFSIVNSMTELESINRVQFLVEGKKVPKYGNIDIEHPIGRNPLLF
ncbi:MAG: GerMN domain-containing protein [Clostridia bacterium]|nr:GerMN domain-containing protein [Clostridia bacterium]